MVLRAKVFYICLLLTFCFTPINLSVEGKKTSSSKHNKKTSQSPPEAPSQPSSQVQDKQTKILELISLRQKQIQGALNDLQVMYEEGLVTLHDFELLKGELRELEQFEFIIKNPSVSSYESALKDKLVNELSALQTDLKTKRELWNGGLIAAKEVEAMEEKAALFNYILEFLSDGNRLPKMLAINGAFLSISMLFGRHIPIESGFGFRIDPIYPSRKQFHAGVDFGAAHGMPIKAPLEGLVTKAVTSTSSGGGMQLRLAHAQNFETVYLHLSKILVKQGQRVKVGDTIALVGATGTRVTGPHLHFEVHQNGIPVNPLKFFRN